MLIKHPSLFSRFVSTDLCIFLHFFTAHSSHGKWNRFHGKMVLATGVDISILWSFGAAPATRWMTPAPQKFPNASMAQFSNSSYAVVFKTRRRLLRKEYSTAQKFRKLLQSVSTSAICSLLWQKYMIISLLRSICAGSATKHLNRLKCKLMYWSHCQFKITWRRNRLPEPFLALQLLNTAHVEENQRVRLLVACVNNMKPEKEIDAFSEKNSGFIKNICYSTSAGVLRQGDSRETGWSLSASLENAITCRKDDKKISGSDHWCGNREGSRNSCLNTHQSSGRRTADETTQMKSERLYYQSNKIFHCLDAQGDGDLLKSGISCHDTS